MGEIEIYLFFMSKVQDLSGLTSALERGDENVGVRDDAKRHGVIDRRRGAF